MTISELAAADSVTLAIAEVQGKVKVTRLKTSTRGATAARRSWSAAAPAGARMHNPVKVVQVGNYGGGTSKAS